MSDIANRYIVTTTYPCCKGVARFNKYKDVPREIFSRQCPQCRSKWEIEIKIALVGGTNLMGEAMLNVLRWGAPR